MNEIVANNYFLKCIHFRPVTVLLIRFFYRTFLPIGMGAKNRSGKVGRFS